jgi:16S rRNA processing protein RimM
VARSKPSLKPQPSNSAGLKTAPPEDLVVMGRLLAPRGIKGWLKVKTFTEEPDALAEFSTWWLRDQQGWSPREVEDIELVHLGFSAKLAGVDDRNAAELMRGIDVALSRSALPQYDDAIYWIDLIGLEVRNTANELLGHVDNLVETGANDVLVVKRPEGSSGGKEMLIPYSEQAVLEVDLKKKKIVVDWQQDWL